MKHDSSDRPALTKQNIEIADAGSGKLCPGCDNSCFKIPYYGTAAGDEGFYKSRDAYPVEFLCIPKAYLNGHLELALDVSIQGSGAQYKCLIGAVPFGGEIEAELVECAHLVDFAKHNIAGQVRSDLVFVSTDGVSQIDDRRAVPSWIRRVPSDYIFNGLWDIDEFSESTFKVSAGCGDWEIDNSLGLDVRGEGFDGRDPSLVEGMPDIVQSIVGYTPQIFGQGLTIFEFESLTSCYVVNITNSGCAVSLKEDFFDFPISLQISLCLPNKELGAFKEVMHDRHRSKKRRRGSKADAENAA